MMCKRPYTNQTTSQGMILISVLLSLMVINILIGSLLGQLPSHLQLAPHWLAEAQQFEAAEAGLRHGEAQLTQLLANNLSSTIHDIPALDYVGYHVELTVRMLPQTVCILPCNRTGHYYQITASAKDPNKSNGTIDIQSTFALPDGETCTPTLIKRWQGRHAWCQLETD